MARKSSKYGFVITSSGETHLDWYGESARRNVQIEFRKLGTDGRDTVLAATVQLTTERTTGHVQFNLYTSDATAFADAAEILRGLPDNVEPADFIAHLGKFEQCAYSWEFGAVPIDQIGKTLYSLPWPIADIVDAAPVFAPDDVCAKKLFIRALADADNGVEAMEKWSNYNLTLQESIVRVEHDPIPFTVAFAPVSLDDVPQKDWDDFANRKAKWDAERAEAAAAKAAKKLAELEVIA